MEIEIIDIKHFIFRVNNKEYMYIKPHSLMKGFGEFISGTVKGSTLGWNIENTFVSFNQIKEAFLLAKKLTEIV